MSPSTTSFYLKKLVSDNIVQVENTQNKKYSIVNQVQIANLISEYHPDLVTNATVNLEEIFSSF